MKNMKPLLLLALIATTYMASAQYYAPPPPGYHPREKQAQNNGPEPLNPTGYFELSIGLSAPSGGFANNFGTGYKGYALPGSCIDVSFGIPLNHSNMGIALMYGGYNNAFDINTYVSSLQMNDRSNSYSGLVQDAYNESFIMGGYFWTWPVQRLSFDARIMGGVALCTLPEVAYEVDVPVTGGYAVNTYDIASSSAASFAFDIGGDIRYKLRRTSIMFGIDYTHANPSASTTEQYEDPNYNYSYSHVSGSMPISVFCFNLGIAYQIR